MKKEKKEREVIAVGEPDLQTLSNKEKNVLFSLLLRSVLEHFMDEDEED